MKTTYRSFQQINDDLLYPGSDGRPGLTIPKDQGKRYCAVQKALTIIPDEDYKRLKDEFSGGIRWFIPPLGAFGQVYRFDVPARRIVFLCAQLEFESDGIVLAVVAHELAHVALRHELPCRSIEMRDQNEQEVFERLVIWDLEQEAIEHEASRSSRRAKLQATLEEAKNT